MIGLKIMLTGALFAAVAVVIAAAHRDLRNKPMWLVVPVVIAFYAGVAAVFVGALVALWGVS